MLNLLGDQAQGYLKIRLLTRCKQRYDRLYQFSDSFIMRVSGVCNYEVSLRNRESADSHILKQAYNQSGLILIIDLKLTWKKINPKYSKINRQCGIIKETRSILTIKTLNHINHILICPYVVSCQALVLQKPHL